MKNTHRALKLTGAALGAVAMIGAAQAASATVVAAATPLTSTDRQQQPIALPSATTVRPRSYKRRRALSGGIRRAGRSAFLTKGNRAQRQRQLHGMQCRNG